MAENSSKNSKTAKRKSPPALTPEARENQLISLAIDEAERQLRAGTASSQIVTHYLKLGTRRYQTECAVLEKKQELLTAQADAYKSAANVEKLYSEAMAMIRKYRGESDETNED